MWSDLAWLSREEVRLLATLALSVPEGCGALTFDPGEAVVIDLPSDVDLRSGAAIEVVRKALLPLCAHQEVNELSTWEMSNLEEQRTIYNAISLRDELLLRGLYCLLKSRLLVGDRRFGEEAFMNLQIAREAALEMIREVLLAKAEVGGRGPSFRDAHAYLVENFRFGEALAEYFSWQHELWIVTKHPASALGPVWIPPLLADDVFDTYASLISVYRHLLLCEEGRATANI